MTDLSALTDEELRRELVTRDQERKRDLAAEALRGVAHLKNIADHSADLSGQYIGSLQDGREQPVTLANVAEALALEFGSEHAQLLEPGKPVPEGWVAWVEDGEHGNNWQHGGWVGDGGLTCWVVVKMVLR